MKSITLLFAIVAISVFCFNEEPADSFPPAMDPVSIAYLDSALMFSGTTRLDVEFEKKWASDTLFRLAIVERMLDKPLELPDSIDTWTRFVIDNPENTDDITRWAFERIDSKIDRVKYRKLESRILNKTKSDTTGSKLPEAFGKALKVILASFDIAAEHRDRMMKNVSDASLDSLLQLLPEFWTDGEDSLADSLECYFLNLLDHECDTSLEIHLDSLYETMHTFDLPELCLATVAVTKGISLAIEILSSDSALPKLHTPTVLTTRWGKAIIGSDETDIFGDAAIIIDPGGNDIYLGEHAVGVIGKTDFGAVIDLSGNDHYDSRNSVFSSATGVFGVGILADLSGDDIYSTTHYGQGAGLFGSGILLDFAGDDLYTGGVFVQGSGNFGIGLLLDLSGEDGYRSYAYAQAFAGPKGFGLLADYKGSDQYFSGGKYSHAPLAPFHYHSFAQGFAIGWRPDVSGGIGFLFDRCGNDTYSAGVYSQGVSYWYSLAMLVDNEGNDVYTSVWYPQGSGIHLSVGALVDRAGDDIYVSPQGPGQGAAHDYSVGFFSEHRGDDIYVIDGGNGIALTNSFALFVDRNGDDTYAKRYDRTNNWAWARSARGTGNLGIFLDLEGNDHYSDRESAGNNRYWLSGEIGFGIDTKGEPFPDPIKELAEKIAEEEPDSDRTIEDIFDEASAWAVGSGIDKAEKAFDELLDSGQVAADYICEFQLGTKSSLRLRTIKNFCIEKPELMRPCLFEALHDEDKMRRGHAIYLFGEMEDTTAVDSLLPFLKDKKTRISAISALGKIKDTKTVPYISKYRNDEKQAVRYMVAKALADIGDPRAIPALIDFLEDDYLTVRIAAQFGLKEMYEHCFDTVLIVLPGAPTVQKLHLLRVINAIYSKAQEDEDMDSIYLERKIATTRRILLSLVGDDNPIIRGHAVRALGTIGGEETIAEMRRRFELEPDPFVRSMYSKALK
ncbi:hypothetical protein DRQ36_05225 [bacterium]|nr:MAG: hypothetical protein DRQ36_05225 [bacterium]